MAKFTRRSLLKGAAGLSLFHMVSPLESLLAIQTRPAPSEESLGTLNVVLHGLFLINITTSDPGGCVELLTPRISEHIYKMGSWNVHKIRTLKKRSKPYCLKGVCDGKPMPQLPYDTCPVLSRSDSNFCVSKEKSRFIFNLPFPDSIKGARTVKGEGNCRLGDTIYITRYSLCVVLTYNRINLENVHVPGVCWRPMRERGYNAKFANLHLWAESGKRANPRHSDLAYEQLSADLLQGVCVKMATDMSAAIDPSPTIDGLPSYQELGWAEWANGGEGTRPRDCCSPIVRP